MLDGAWGSQLWQIKNAEDRRKQLGNKNNCDKSLKNFSIILFFNA